MQNEILHFLSQLLTAQERTINVLTAKQRFLVKPDRDGLAKIAVEEREVLALLDSSLKRREEILAAAKTQGKASDSIQSLCQQIFPKNSEIFRRIDEAAHRSRMIRNLSLTNWIMTQKSIIHLTQMLEIIATKGQGKSTYNRQSSQETGISGSGFVDRVA